MADWKGFRLGYSDLGILPKLRRGSQAVPSKNALLSYAAVRVPDTCEAFKVSSHLAKATHYYSSKLVYIIGRIRNR